LRAVSGRTDQVELHRGICPARGGGVRDIQEVVSWELVSRTVKAGIRGRTVKEHYEKSEQAGSRILCRRDGGVRPSISYPCPRRVSTRARPAMDPGATFFGICKRHHSGRGGGGYCDRNSGTLLGNIAGNSAFGSPAACLCPQAGRKYPRSGSVDQRL